MASQAAQPAASLDANQAAGAPSQQDSKSRTGKTQASASSAPESELALAKYDMGRFGDIPYRIEILIGSAVKTIREILEMETGDTVVLDRQAHEPVILAIEDRAVAQAEVVSSDNGASIQITEVGWEE
ncbi:MAG TPA: FliM/FliN family flagellar motor C-terminal domain-containing protein [Acidobacteriota bacterium]|nr:FliM/FliN family flagellar motor C-terminal domain-containing protein [Acidobacteriota bacterium]